MMRDFGLFICSFAIIGFVGCSGMYSDKWTEQRADLAPAKGIVLIDGKPIEGATVNFYSQTQDVTAYGRTDSEGQFTLTTYEPNDGAVAGAHKVTVKKSELKTVMNPQDPELGPISSEEIWYTPKAYRLESTTPLSIELPAAGNTDIKLELSSK